MTSLVVLMAKFLLYLVVLIGVIFWLIVPRGQKVRLAVIGALAGILALVLTKLAGSLYYDPRPFVVQHTEPLLQHVADNGMPSDHTVLAALVAVTIFQVSRKVGLVLFFLALLLGVSRVLVQIHSPIDIVVGLAIGVGSVALAVPLTKKLLRGRYKLV